MYSKIQKLITSIAVTLAMILTLTPVNVMAQQEFKLIKYQQDSWGNKVRVYVTWGMINSVSGVIVNDVEYQKVNSSSYSMAPNTYYLNDSDHFIELPKFKTGDVLKVKAEGNIHEYTIEKDDTGFGYQNISNGYNVYPETDNSNPSDGDNGEDNPDPIPDPDPNPQPKELTFTYEKDFNQFYLVAEPSEKINEVTDVYVNYQQYTKVEYLWLQGVSDQSYTINNGKITMYPQKMNDLIQIHLNDGKVLSYIYLGNSIKQVSGEEIPSRKYLHARLVGSYECALLGQEEYDGISGASGSVTSHNNSNAEVQVCVDENENGPTDDHAWKVFDMYNEIGVDNKTKAKIEPEGSGMKALYHQENGSVTLTGKPVKVGNYNISVTVVDSSGRTVVTNTLPFNVYSGEEKLIDVLKIENANQMQDGKYMWDMEPWFIRHFGGENETVTVPQDIKAIFGSHTSGTYGLLGNDKLGRSSQTLIVGANTHLTLVNMKIGPSVRIIVQDGGYLNLQDSVAYGEIVVKDGSSFQMNYDSFNNKPLFGSSISGQLILEEGATLKSSYIHSNTNYIASGLQNQTATVNSNVEPVVKVTGNAFIEGTVCIEGDEAPTGIDPNTQKNYTGQKGLLVDHSTLTIKDDSTLAVYGGGYTPLSSLGSDAITLDQGTITGNGTLVAIGGMGQTGKGGFGVAGNGRIENNKAYLAGGDTYSNQQENAGVAYAPTVTIAQNKPIGRAVEGNVYHILADSDSPYYWKNPAIEIPDLSKIPFGDEPINKVESSWVLESLNVTVKDNKKFARNANITKQDLVVTAVMVDENGISQDKKQVVIDDYTIDKPLVGEGLQPSKTERQEEHSVSKDGVKGTFNVTITADPAKKLILKSLSVEVKGNKKFARNTTITTNDLTVTGHYEDENNVWPAEDKVVTDYDIDNPTVGATLDPSVEERPEAHSVSKDGVTGAFNVTVAKDPAKKLVLKSLSVEVKDDKKFARNTTITTDELIVTGHYEDENNVWPAEDKIVTDYVIDNPTIGATLDPSVEERPEEHSVSKDGVTGTFNVTITADPAKKLVLKSLSVEVKDGKKFARNTDITTDDLIVTGHYEDENNVWPAEDKEVTDYVIDNPTVGATLEPSVEERPEEHSVSKDGVVGKFEVTITADPAKKLVLKSLSVEVKDDKKFARNTDITTDDLIVTGHYEDENNVWPAEDKEVTDYVIDNPTVGATLDPSVEERPEEHSVSKDGVVGKFEVTIQKDVEASWTLDSVVVKVKGDKKFAEDETIQNKDLEVIGKYIDGNHVWPAKEEKIQSFEIVNPKAITPKDHVGEVIEVHAIKFNNQEYTFNVTFVFGKKASHFVKLDEKDKEYEADQTEYYTDEMMKFGSTAPFNEFVALYIDDQFVEESNYDKYEGSTIIKLHKDYSSKLSVQKHKVRLVFKNVTTEGILNVLKRKEEPKKPTTPTNNNSSKVKPKKNQEVSNYHGEVTGAKFNQQTNKYEALPGYQWNESKQMFVKQDAFTSNKVPRTGDPGLASFIWMLVLSLGAIVGVTIAFKRNVQ